MANISLVNLTLSKRDGGKQRCIVRETRERAYIYRMEQGHLEGWKKLKTYKRYKKQVLETDIERIFGIALINTKRFPFHSGNVTIEERIQFGYPLPTMLKDLIRAINHQLQPTNRSR